MVNEVGAVALEQVDVGREVKLGEPALVANTRWWAPEVRGAGAEWWEMEGPISDQMRFSIT